MADEEVEIGVGWPMDTAAACDVVVVAAIVAGDSRDHRHASRSHAAACTKARARLMPDAPGCAVAVVAASARPRMWIA